jgi:hypothetical protein
MATQQRVMTACARLVMSTGIKVRACLEELYVFFLLLLFFSIGR